MKIPSDKNTTSAKKKRLITTWEQKFNVTERHELGFDGLENDDVRELLNSHSKNWLMMIYF
jgi:hypothetical protein